MTDAIAIHGHDMIDLVASHPEGIRLSQLMEIVEERYGRMPGLLHLRSNQDARRMLPPGGLRSIGASTLNGCMHSPPHRRRA